ncbi:MAG: pyridoxamine 5'-phosphate oxidase family protein [Fidelibacterota bacterium]
MRRNDYLCNSNELVLSALFKESIGYLGITDSLGFPRPVPLQFVESNGRIYFHGANSGEKYTAFLQKQLLSFSLVKELSMIPSYWRAKGYACPATSYYLSAYGTATGKLITESDEKAKYLQLLMEKYQPEGRFTEISPEIKMYKEPLEETAVFEMKISSWNIKCKVGQNMNRKAFQNILDKLRERGTKIDLETLWWMKQITRPTSSGKK